MRRKSLLQTVGFALLLLGLCWAGEADNAADDPGPDKAAEAPAKKPDTPDVPTEITADSLEYDITKRIVVFNGNVYAVVVLTSNEQTVADNRLKLKADKMTVFFDDQNEVIKIIAVGKVVAENADNKAAGGRAEYEQKTDVVTLSDNPVLITGEMQTEGAEKVIFYGQKDGRFKTVGGKPKTTIIRPNLNEVKEPRAMPSSGSNATKQKTPPK